MAFELPQLPFSADALVPHMTAECFEYHHGKHHQAYVTKLNELVQGTPMAEMALDAIVKATAGDASKRAIFNNAGQHWNHSDFWLSMKPGGGGTLPGALEKKINEDFGSVAAFREQFIAAGVGQFGSGWCWLVQDNGKLAVTNSPNAETPMTEGKTVLVTCDVWEHAYYIDYRNARPKYLEAFLDHLVNWERAEAALAAAS